MRIKKEKSKMDETDVTQAALVAESLNGNSMATLALSPRLREQVRIERYDRQIEARERIDMYIKITLVVVLVFFVAALISFMFIHR